MIPGLSRRFIVAAMLVGLAVWGGGCGAGRRVGEATSAGDLRRFEYRRIVMGVEARIVMEAADEDAAFGAASAGFERLAELNARLSDYQMDSELNRLVRGPVGVAQSVSEDLWRVLVTAKEVHAASSGAFDVTVGHATRLWRVARATGRASDAADLAFARARIDMSAIGLDEATRSVTLARGDLQLDLGGIAKGYAAQEAVRRLREKGIERCLVALAGDIAVGDAPGGSAGWRIGVEAGGGRGRDPGLGEIVLANACVSTSGSSEQFVVIDGVRQSHMLDPRTGMGTTHGAMVTVIGPDGARADALATALCVMEPAQRAGLMAAHPEYRFIVRESR